MEAEKEKNPNMEIWEQVSTTAKEFTKPIEGRGFLGTSINPTYVMEKLTKLFGPIGIGWGFKVLSEEYRKGHTDLENTVEVHVVLIAFWYQWKGAKSEDIQSYGQTYFVRETSKGWVTDEEAPKKSLTDAVTKAASFIGVSADIFTGKWDGDKYRNSDQTKPHKPTSNEDRFIVCPVCGAQAVMESKYSGGGWFCYKKVKGCGAKFVDKPMSVVLSEKKENLEYISEDERRELCAIAEDCNWTPDHLKKWVFDNYGVSQSDQIKQGQYDEIKKFIKANVRAPGQEREACTK